MKSFLISAFCFLFLLSSCKENESKPNILFIFADDLHYNTINALGAQELISPNLDNLATSGVSFSHSFNMGGWNGAVCIASRTMMLTGRSIWEAHRADSLLAKNNYTDPLWSQLLENEGYDTYMTGKWHIKTAADSVFMEAVHIRPGMPNQTKSGYNRPTSVNDTSWRAWDKSKEGFWKGGKHWSEVLADDALGFLAEAGKNEKPFFMYLAFNAPHDPRQSPKEFVEKYPIDEVAVPKSFLSEYPYKEEMGSGKTLRDEMLAPFPRTKHAIKVNRQEYYASITHMDEQVGKIIAALKATGKIENTYIIFAADHGLSVGHHGLLGKQSMYDHSMRTPLIISGPNLAKNIQVDADVYVQDIMPTVLELTGIEKPDYVDFNSLLSIAKEERQESHYPAIYGAYTHTQRMIRKNGFKLIAYPEAQRLRLFDLNQDPMEMNDLADDPSFKDLKEQLFFELLQLQDEMKDKLDLSQISFN